MADPNVVNQTMRESVPPEMFTQWKQLCDFFGTPRVMPTMTQLRAKDVWDYFEMFTGPQSEMSEAVHKDFKQNVTFPLDVFPMQEVKGDEFEWIRFELESQVMDESTEQMPNTIIESTMVKDSAIMQSRGASFLMNADFIFSENGIDLFHEYCRGLEKCVANTLGDDVLTTIRRVAVQNFLEKIGQQQNEEQFHRLLQGIVSKFAIFQKQRDGLSIVQSECAEALGQQDLEADLEINPQGSTRYHEYIDPQRNTASLGGDNLLPKAYETDRVVQYVKQFPKIRSQQSRTYKQAGNRTARDAFYRPVVVGGHTVAMDIVTDTVGIEKYRSSYRDIVIGDSRKVKARKTLKEIASNSMIWLANGNISQIGAEILDVILERTEDSAGPGYTLEEMYEKAGLLNRVTEFVTKTPEGKQRYAKFSGGKTAPVASSIEAAFSASLAPESGESKRDGARPVGAFGMLFTLETVNKLIEADLPVPLGFILSRHSQAMIAGCYVQCASKGAGMIAENRWMMDLTKNTKQRKVGVNLNYSAKCIIKKRENFVFVPDVFVRNIISGMGTQIYGPADSSPAHFMPGAKDIHVLAVPYKFELPNTWNDITGQVHPDMLQPPQLNASPTYPTAHLYQRIWQWPSTPTNLFQESYWSPAQGEMPVNTLTLQEWQQYCVPQDLDTGVMGAQILGSHWIGDKIYPGTYRALRGEDTFMTQSHYDPKQVEVNK